MYNDTVLEGSNMGRVFSSRNVSVVQDENCTANSEWLLIFDSRVEVVLIVCAYDKRNANNRGKKSLMEKVCL